MTESTRSAATAALERYTIAAIPESERHGRPRDPFTIWFSSNIMPLTFVTGALAPVALSCRWPPASSRRPGLTVHEFGSDAAAQSGN